MVSLYRRLRSEEADNYGTCSLPAVTLVIRAPTCVRANFSILFIVCQTRSPCVPCGDLASARLAKTTIRLQQLLMDKFIGRSGSGCIDLVTVLAELL